MTTAIIGTGAIGSRLAADLTAGGESVLLASRDLDRTRELADRLGERATATTVDQAVEMADVLVLAVWFDTIKELIAQYGDRLAGKVVVDPSNPIAVDDQGTFSKTIPEDQSAGVIIAGLLPAGARPVKAFGTLLAPSLESEARREPERGAGFFATDDQGAGEEVARLIRAAGFDPVPVGGIDQSIRIEVFGDLHEGTLGRVPTVEEARALV
ncbi:NAD(P)-binding domain-containing protein [Streptomyces sp. NPDC005955]|uniref:NADPH-dependent F420 reductase n=1 Tax=Streptomyces sp. NPDC005955 TaxID=3364738 RepID=UPI0036C175FC